MLPARLARASLRAAAWVTRTRPVALTATDFSHSSSGKFSKRVGFDGGDRGVELGVDRSEVHQHVEPPEGHSATASNSASTSAGLVTSAATREQLVAPVVALAQPTSACASSASAPRSVTHDVRTVRGVRSADLAPDEPGGPGHQDHLARAGRIHACSCRLPSVRLAPDVHRRLALCARRVAAIPASSPGSGCLAALEALEKIPQLRHEHVVAIPARRHVRPLPPGLARSRLPAVSPRRRRDRRAASGYRQSSPAPPDLWCRRARMTRSRRPLVEVEVQIGDRRRPRACSSRSTSRSVTSMRSGDSGSGHRASPGATGPNSHSAEVECRG